MRRVVSYRDNMLKEVFFEGRRADPAGWPSAVTAEIRVRQAREKQLIKSFEWPFAVYREGLK